MKANEITNDTYEVGKVRENGTVCVTEARVLCDGSVNIKGYQYDLSKQVKKVLFQVQPDENER